MSSADENKADVVIVSAFGRGNWLAMELASRGWKTSLIDVSERLGQAEPADAEGPFGLFESSDLLPSQKTRLTDEGETMTASRGFTLWLPEGPIEFRSELTAFQLQQRGIPGAVEAYLRQLGTASPSLERDRRAVLKLPYQSNWLVHFAHQFASPLLRENHLAGEHDVGRPLFAPFSVRQATERGFEKGLKICQAAGVRLRAKASIKDVGLSGALVDAVEVQDERSGVERGRAFVWALSGVETAALNASTRNVVFPKGSDEPAWYWGRYRFELRGRAFADQFPPLVAMIGDVDLPWTHGNLLVIRRRETELPLALDIWVRLPNATRGNRPYLEEVASDIEWRLASKLPQSEPALKDLPREAKMSEGVAGAPLWPVFDPEAYGQGRTLNAANFFAIGPDTWDALDWLGSFRRQLVALGKLQKLKDQWDAAARREAARSPSP